MLNSNLFKKSFEGYIFGHFLGTLLFRVNILLAETYCYNWSGRQDSNLWPSAPKALDQQIATAD